MFFILIKKDGEFALEVQQDIAKKYIKIEDVNHPAINDGA